ncbi:MAG TPA: hypothetical protein DIT01_11100, partial [Lentisphaeria bacterium]|nr:hypothetical protein [Lentisphaeria bacterium]
MKKKDGWKDQEEKQRGTIASTFLPDLLHEVFPRIPGCQSFDIQYSCVFDRNNILNRTPTMEVDAKQFLKDG